MRKIILALILLNSAFLNAQIKSFVREYSYKAGEADSKLSSKTLALKEVKSLLLEEIGVYLSSEFENKIEQKKVNDKIEFNQLTKSNITTLAAGITKTTILDEKWNGETYYLKAEIIVDVDDVKKKLNELVNDKSKTKELQDLLAKNKEANDVIDKLKRELETAKAKNIELSEKDKNRIQEEYNAKIIILDANEWFQKGYNASAAKEYQNSIIYYNKAIQLNPDFAIAYNNIGIAKFRSQDAIGATADFSKAIKQNPNDALPYYNRGTAKYDLRDFNGSIDDFDKAIQLNPNYVEAYINRGLAKCDLKDLKGGIADFNKAIQLNPYNALAYYNRGLTKYDLQDVKGAITDYNKAIQINPDYAEAYINLGVAKSDLKDYESAKADFNKAIQINPNYAIAYYYRGSAKACLKDMYGACLDWSKSGELGFSQGYEIIKKLCNK